MRLALFHWPPLASHAACVVLGILCQHVDPLRVRTISLDEDSVIVALPESALGVLPEKKTMRPLPPFVPTRVFLGAFVSGSLCRLTRGSVRLLQREPTPAVVVRLPQERDFLLEASALQRSHLRLIVEAQGKHLEPCEEMYQVRYGLGRGK